MNTLEDETVDLVKDVISSEQDQEDEIEEEKTSAARTEKVVEQNQEPETLADEQETNSGIDSSTETADRSDRGTVSRTDRREKEE